MNLDFDSNSITNQKEKSKTPFWKSSLKNLKTYISKYLTSDKKESTDNQKFSFEKIPNSNFDMNFQESYNDDNKISDFRSDLNLKSSPISITNKRKYFELNNEDTDSNPMKSQLNLETNTLFDKIKKDNSINHFKESNNDSIKITKKRKRKSISSPVQNKNDFKNKSKKVIYRDSRFITTFSNDDLERSSIKDELVDRYPFFDIDDIKNGEEKEGCNKQINSLKDEIKLMKHEIMLLKKCLFDQKIREEKIKDSLKENKYLKHKNKDIYFEDSLISEIFDDDSDSEEKTSDIIKNKKDNSEKIFDISRDKKEIASKHVGDSKVMKIKGINKITKKKKKNANKIEKKDIKETNENCPICYMDYDSVDHSLCKAEIKEKQSKKTDNHLPLFTSNTNEIQSNKDSLFSFDNKYKNTEEKSNPKKRIKSNSLFTENQTKEKSDLFSLPINQNDNILNKLGDNKSIVSDLNDILNSKEKTGKKESLQIDKKLESTDKIHKPIVTINLDNDKINNDNKIESGIMNNPMNSKNDLVENMDTRSENNSNEKNIDDNKDNINIPKDFSTFLKEDKSSNTNDPFKFNTSSNNTGVLFSNKNSSMDINKSSSIKNDIFSQFKPSQTNINKISTDKNFFSSQTKTNNPTMNFFDNQFKSGFPSQTNSGLSMNTSMDTNVNKPNSMFDNKMRSSVLGSTSMSIDQGKSSQNTNNMFGSMSKPINTKLNTSNIPSFRKFDKPFTTPMPKNTDKFFGMEKPSNDIGTFEKTNKPRVIVRGSRRRRRDY